MLNSSLKLFSRIVLKKKFVIKGEVHKGDIKEYIEIYDYN
jgi:hypothetical protein